MMLRIAIVLAIALRVSLILLLRQIGPPEAFRASDSITYTTGAQSLASSGELLDDHGKPEIPQFNPEMYARARSSGCRRRTTSAN